ncbi:MAG: hypothetical protein IJU62_07550 [Muribaculaceae bacterium]|nr:hypothetical protein [Muribaculaceae bacterium]
MDFIHNTACGRLVELTIDFDEVLASLYTESDWYTLGRPELSPLTARDSRLLEQRIAEGVADLHTRFAAYLAFVNINPNTDDSNIFLAFELPSRIPKWLPAALRGAVVATLSAYVLMRAYEPAGSIAANAGGGLYATAWRRNRARIALLLARAELS